MKIKVIGVDTPSAKDLAENLVRLDSREFRAVVKAAVSSRRAKKTLAKVGIV